MSSTTTAFGRRGQRRGFWLPWWSAASFVLVVTTSCGSNVTSEVNANLGCEIGTEGCTCYGNWSCNYQLSCVEDLCVDRRKQKASPQVENDDLTTLRSNDPIAGSITAPCAACLDEQCQSALSECYSETGCAPLFSCLTRCNRAEPGAGADQNTAPAAQVEACAERCLAESAATAHSPASQLWGCSNTTCSETCEAAPSTSF